MLYQIFLSPQVKRIEIISNKHGIYELSYELTNDLRYYDLRKLENIKKISNPDRIIAQRQPPGPQNENFVNTSKKLLKN